MSNRSTVLGVVVVLALAALGSQAQAGFIPVGDPEPGGSWAVHFTSDSGIGFHSIGVHIQSAGDTFASPALTDISGGWIEHDDSGLTSAFANDPVWLGSTWTDGDIVVHFANDLSDPVEFLMTGWEYDNGWILRESTLVSWNGTDFALSPGSFNLPSEFYPTLIPLPAPVLMGGLGLFGLVLCRNRLRRLAG